MQKIAVITPTYNRKELLLRALRSIQNQSYPYWKSYIIDDCSVDNVLRYLNQNGILDDERFVYIRLEQNSGVNVARNRALEEISKNGEIDFITLLDDDDYFLNNYFTEMIKITKETNANWIVSKCINQNREIVTKVKKYGFVNYLDYYSSKLMSGDATMFFSKKIAENILFTTKVKNGYEWYFFLKMSMRSSMYVVDFVSKVVEYQKDGLTKNYKKEKINKRAFKREAFKECGYSYFWFSIRNKIGNFFR